VTSDLRTRRTSGRFGAAGLERTSAAAGTFAAAIGALALAGWVLDLDVLKGAGGSITMKPNAALGLVACALSLRGYVSSRRAVRRLAPVLAVFGAAIGILTLSQHIFGWNLRIDELLFAEGPGSPATASPGRMGPVASSSIAAAGIALLTLRRRPGLSQTLTLVSGTLSFIALVGYWYRVQELYSVARYTGIAWPTALALEVLSLGVLTANAQVGPASVLTSGGPGGILARRLIIPAILVPPALGYLRVAGQQAGMYDTGLGIALLVVALVMLFTLLIWRTALSLDATDRVRAAVEQERDDLLLRERSARQTAERANQLKDEFLATVSHELRTPLNAIVGWTQLLRASLVPEERRTHAAEVVARNAKFLARLIEDLLDVSRIASGQISLDVRRVNLASVAERAIDSFAAAARERNINLVSRLDGVEAFVIGDAERLQQIANNLLSNAVKFTPPGGRIDVSVRLDGGTADLVVADTGRGIRPEFLPHVFDKFRQEDATATREYGGLGLGLAIARDLAALHNGEVQAFSDGAGRGATFRLRLPRVEEDEGASVAQPGVSSRVQGG
jgi:signal transduction histidine kinase